MKDVYSNRLTDEDETPTGKKVQQSLRALEKALEEQLTLDCCFKENIKLRKLKQSTLTNYKYIYERHIKPKFGCMFITDISHKMIKDHLISLIEDGFKPNSVECIYSILSPIFEMAVQRNIIVKNPVKYIMNEIKEEYGNFSKRLPLSDVEEMSFIEYIKSHKRYGSYYPLFSILLKTGCEAGEILGLTWDDVDTEKRTITISHKIIYRQQESGKCENHIIKFDEPKHIKVISIDADIEHLLLTIRNCQNKMQFAGNNVVDGYSNFIFLNNCGNVQSTRGINRILSSIVNSYNGEEREIKMPKITTDTLKLTYRKNMANQYLS